MFVALENLDSGYDDTGIIEDHDEILCPDEQLFEAGTDLNDIGQITEEMGDLNNTAGELENLREAVEAFGVTQSLMAFANKGGVLSNAIPAFAACEALGAAGAPIGSPQYDAALEGILGKTEDMIGAWFKKAWDYVTHIGEKILNFGHAAYAKSVGAIHWVGSKVFDAAKAAKDVITAHPVMSAIGALALLGAAAPIFMGMWAEALPASAAEFGTWTSTQASKIAKFGRDGWKATKGAAGSAADVVKGAAGTAYDAVKSGTGQALDYTKEKWTELSNSAMATFKEGGAVNRFGKYMKESAEGALTKLKSLGGDAVKWGRNAIDWLSKKTGEVWGWLCTKASRIWTSVVSTFKQFFTRDVEVEASTAVAKDMEVSRANLAHDPEAAAQYEHFLDHHAKHAPHIFKNKAHYNAALSKHVKGLGKSARMAMV